MTNKLYILLCNLYIFIVFDFLDTKKQPIALLQPAVSYLIPLSSRRGVRGEVN